MSDTKSSIESVNEIYQGRVDNLAAAAEKDTAEREEAEANSSLESVEHELPDEAKFVGNPEGLRKEVDSEEKFSKDLDDGDDTLEVPGGEAKAPAKKTAAKKTAGK